MLTLARIRLPENSVYQCRVPASVTVVPGEICLAELEYGLDYGTVLDLTGHTELGEGEGRGPAFRIVRKQGAEDVSRLNENAQLAEKATQAFQLSVSREKGHVKLLHTRFSYGRDRFFIRYTAQIPVDLRRFVGQIQRDFKTHVDLWQVGIRDETALLGCLGSCGRAACCCTWQKQFEPVNVLMAKSQEMSLNPVTLNGTCGRLKCCLRFEYEQYCEYGECLPPLRSVVTFPAADETRTDVEEEGQVIGRDILRGRLTVRTRDGRHMTVSAKAVTGKRNREREYGTGKEDDNDANSRGEWTES